MGFSREPEHILRTTLLALRTTSVFLLLFLLTGAAMAQGGRPASSHGVYEPYSGTALFLNDPETACDVHLPREAAVPPGTAWGQWPGYRALCENWRPSDGEIWPKVFFDPLDPDRADVYGYPLVASGDEPDRRSQDPAVDHWPICVSSDLDRVMSDPAIQICPLDTQAIGRCTASAAYHERLRRRDSQLVGFPAKGFYSFVQTHRDCVSPQQPACAHDPASAVIACKQTCDRYFGRMGYDATNTAHGPLGSWVETDDPQIALRHSTLKLRGRPLYESCLDSCGPPNFDSEIGAGELVRPPWVSGLRLKEKKREERRNHWHYVGYSRGWKPGNQMDNWLRSYAVNKDKPYQPGNICHKSLKKYCRRIPVPEGLPKSLVYRNCLKAQFPESPFNQERYGFCANLSRGNLLCPNTCHAAGGDADIKLLGTNRLCGFSRSNEYSGPLPLAVPEKIRRRFRCAPSTARCEACEGNDPSGCKHAVALDLAESSATDSNGLLLENSISLRAGFYDFRGQVIRSPGITGTWKNSTTGQTGDLTRDGATWRSNQLVDLVAGGNLLEVFFTDDHSIVFSDSLTLEKTTTKF